MKYMIMDLSDGSIVADCFDSREEAQRSAINIFVAKDKWRMLNGFKPIEDNLIALPSVGDMFAYISREEACDKPPEEDEPENEDVKLEPVPIEDVTITFQGIKLIVHCANCTFMSIEKDWCYFYKSILLGSNSGVCTCENAKPRITMEHCKKCGWRYEGYAGCDGIDGKTECPIAKDKPPVPHIPVVPLCATDEDIGHQGICHKCKSLNTDTMVCEMEHTFAIHHGIKYCADFRLPTTPGEITLEIEDPCKKKANELLDVLTEIAQEPNAYKVLTDKNHWQRCENCKHYDLANSYCRHESPPSVWSINKHNLCDKFEVKT